MTNEAAIYLMKKGYKPEFGARPLKRLIQNEILNELSKRLIDGSLNREDIIEIDAQNVKLVFKKNKR